MQTETHHYRLSYAEWLAGIRFGRRRNPMWMLRFLLSWLIPAFFMYFIIAGIWNVLHNATPRGDVAKGTGVFAFPLVAIVGYRVYRLRRRYSLSAYARHVEGIALAFNDEYFVSGLPGRSEGRFLWPALFDFAENKKMALIYTSNNFFIVVPKHAMPEPSWALLRSLAPRRGKA